MNYPTSFCRVYGAASIVALITVYGLLSALFGDGIWDELSWIALAVPLAVIAWKWWGPKKAVSGRL